jgi:hypothetical protein
MTTLRRAGLALGLLAAGLAPASTALALAREPRVASDAFYVGMRVGPGAALHAMWDLDIYLSRDRSVSLGPGVGLSVLGTGERQGTVQDLLVAADVLRLKLEVDESGGEWRPYLMIGGGFSWAKLPAQDVTGVAVVGMDGMTTTTGTQRLPALEEFAPMMTLGWGADVFAGGTWGLALLIQTHFHLSGSARVPDVWADVALGIRFGI